MTNAFKDTVRDELLAFSKASHKNMKEVWVCIVDLEKRITAIEDLLRLHELE